MNDGQEGKVKSKDLRTAILKAALHLFSTRGYFSTSVQDIRREAGVSVGAVYHYFPGKEAIAKALYDNLVGWLSKEMEEIREHHSSAHDRCLAAVAQLFAASEAFPEAMEFVLYARHRDFMLEEKPICSSRPFALMKEMVVEGIASGEIRDIDPTVAAASLFGGPIRMIHLFLDGATEGPLKLRLEAIWDCAWRSVAR